MFTRVENSIIQPHRRAGYEPIEGYPENIVFGHSTRWPSIIKKLSERHPDIQVGKRTKGHFEDELDFTFQDIPMKYVLAPEGTLGLQTQIVKHAMRGGVNLVNIGCVGGINPQLREGDLVVCKEAIRRSGFGVHLASPDEKATTSEILNSLIQEAAARLSLLAVQANVWCVETLYYTFDQLHELIENGLNPDIVEMEMEAGAITTGWLNHNYFGDKPRHFAQVGYVSDRLPIREGEWPDPFKGNKTKMMVPWKENAFLTAINALAMLQ